MLLAWVPGDAGADAIADVLVGAVNPGGKLPITIPRHVGQVPVSYRHHPTGGHSAWKGDYVDGPVAPLWPFGFGRSYTTFELVEPAHRPREGSDEDGEVSCRSTSTNTGGRHGDEVVQLYVRDPEARLARPVLELRGFRRVGLEPGERRTVAFTLSRNSWRTSAPTTGGWWSRARSGSSSGRPPRTCHARGASSSWARPSTWSSATGTSRRPWLPDVRVVIDPAVAVGAIDPRLFGSFVEHIGRAVYGGIFAPGHPAADRDGWRRDVLGLVRELG